MGKCSGLKGGGHHRRALDVQAKKQAQKTAKKTEQVNAGKRAAILREILTSIDVDCELYLDAAVCDNSNNSNGNHNHASLPDVCRKNFRFDSCTNKRCRFSKDYSIAEALQNTISGTNSDDADDGPDTLPALRRLPCVLEENQTKKHRPFRLPRQLEEDSADRTWSLLETAVSEGSSAIDTILSCLGDDADVVNLGLSCHHLCKLVLEGGDGSGCPSVKWRKSRARERRLESRKATLLSNKQLAASLRYAVSYLDDSKMPSGGGGGKKKGGKKNKGGKANQARRLRPMLVFDFENPHVYTAFKESGIRKTYQTALSENLTKKCSVNE